ncbi:MAG: hypothetical protein ACRDFB_03420 [Rhabdochlamydiaceae bacterium]
MLIAGSDVAGNRYDGEHRVIAFVIGTEESINNLYNKIGLKSIHMSKLEEVDRKKVTDNLEFRDGERFAFSLMVEKIKTVHSTHERMKKTDPLYDIGVIFQHFDTQLFDRIKSKILTILEKHGVDKKQLVVECENDMSKTIRIWGMNAGEMGKAYELSDAVAWCCNKGKNVKGIIKIELSKDLRKQMEKDFKN